MKTVAFVPVKLVNMRTPGKNLKPFSDGTPLIHFVQNELLKIKSEGLIDDVYVFCSSEDIKPYLLDGVNLLIRPSYLDNQETKGTDIYSAFVNMIDADIYVLAHATSPFVAANHIKDCIEHVASESYDSAFCAKKIQNFLWKDDKPLNFVLNDPPRTQDMIPIFMELSTAYVFTRETFLQYNSRSGVKPYICECSEIEAIDIDFPEDFDLANVVYTHLLKK